jgi:hypothetical protein
MLSPTATNPLVVYQFHVLLLHTSPAIWRRLLVTSATTVAQLHCALQISLAWSDTQSYCFALHGHEFGRPSPHSRRAVIAASQLPLSHWPLRLTERLLYTYGALAPWRLQLRLEKLLSCDLSRSYPYCLAGARQGPPEYCAGPNHFMVLRERHSRERVHQRLREITAICQAQPAQIEPYRPEVRRLNYWLQPDHFDRKTLNQHLQQQVAGTYTWPQPDKEVDPCNLDLLSGCLSLVGRWFSPVLPVVASNWPLCSSNSELLYSFTAALRIVQRGEISSRLRKVCCE